GDRSRGELGRAAAGARSARGEARPRRGGPRPDRDPAREAAPAARARVPVERVPARGAGDAHSLPGAGTVNVPFSTQIVNVLAALLLLIAFAMLSQRRVLT